MIKSANTALYQKPSLFMNARVNALALSEVEKPASAIGMNMIACAKIIGITLAELTFNGMY